MSYSHSPQHTHAHKETSTTDSQILELRFFSCFILLHVTRGGVLGSLSLSFSLSLPVTLSCLPSALPVNSQLIFLLTWTVMHFCFPNVLALPLLPAVLRVLPYLSPPLPPHLEKICLTNRRPGKLALLSFLSIAPISSLLLSSISPSVRCPIERTHAHPQIHT